MLQSILSYVRMHSQIQTQILDSTVAWEPRATTLCNFPFPTRESWGPKENLCPWDEADPAPPLPQSQGRAEQRPKFAPKARAMQGRCQNRPAERGPCTAAASADSCGALRALDRRVLEGIGPQMLAFEKEGGKGGVERRRGKRDGGRGEERSEEDRKKMEKEERKQ